MYVAEHRGRNYPRYAVKAGLVLACTQIVLGVLSIIFQIIGIALGEAHAGGVGIYSGVVFIIAGGLGIGASKSSGGRCLVISTMVMSIIAAVFAGAGQVVGGSLNMVIFHTNYHYGHYSDIDCNPPTQCHPNPYQANFTCEYEPYNHTCIADPKNLFAKVTWKCERLTAVCSEVSGVSNDLAAIDTRAPHYAVLAVLIFLALVELCVAITQSALCCHGCCCRNDTSQQRMYYAVAPQQVTVGGEPAAVVPAPAPVPAGVAATTTVAPGDGALSGVIQLPNGQLAVIVDNPGPSSGVVQTSGGTPPPPYVAQEEAKEPL